VRLATDQIPAFLIKESEYPLVIVALKEIIEIRLKDAPPARPEKL